jgi:hypothetical protein
MSRTKPFAMTGTAELNAMIERVAPDILALLAVTDQVKESGGRYAPVTTTEP